MLTDFMTIEIDGEEIESLYSDLIVLEVDLDAELAAMFRMRLCMLRTVDTWANLDDERIQIWKPISISAGLAEDNTETLLQGYITHVQAHFGQNPNEAYLDVWGMDSSVMMDRVEILKDWPNKKDSDIVNEILQNYSVSADVSDSEYVHEEALSTIIQRETDLNFIKRLALRNGCEFYFTGDTAVFKPPQLEGDPQPVLAVHFGEETNTHNFSLEVNAVGPSNIGMFQVDKMNKTVIAVNQQVSEQALLAGQDVSSTFSGGMLPAQMYVAANGASSEVEMTALCRSVYHQAEWFIEAKGEVSANFYQHVLMPRKTVTIKGIGDSYCGIYYVHHVTHVFQSGGYNQYFKARRNGLMLRGDENFGGEEGFF